MMAAGLVLSAVGLVHMPCRVKGFAVKAPSMPRLQVKLATEAETLRKLLASPGNEAPLLAHLSAAPGYEAALKAGMDDPAIDQSIRQTYELANALGISGTPSFVI